MTVRADPFDRLGAPAREDVEDAVDRFRGAGCGGRGDAWALGRDLRRIGFTKEEAERHVALVISTQV